MVSSHTSPHGEAEEQKAREPKEEVFQVCQGGHRNVLPPFLRLRTPEAWAWWEKHASSEVLHLLAQGVEPNFCCPPLPLIPQGRSVSDQEAALHIIQEYIQQGAAKEVQMQGTAYLVPWFVLKKQELGGGEKIRLISDCRAVNKYLSPKPFKLDHWKDIFPCLRQGDFAVKLDLKDAYFHLELSEKIKPFVRLLIGDRVFQMEGACFGLSTLPQLWMKVMGVFLKKWRAQGLQVFIYLDDILLVGRSKDLVQRQLHIMLEDLDTAGMGLNSKKSVLTPCQQVNHLGFTIDLKKGLLMVPPEKLKTVRKELGKLLTNSALSCRKMAAILGQVRSFLTALPFLRAFTDQLQVFVGRQEREGWDRRIPIPAELKSQVQELKEVFAEWAGRPLQGGRVAVRNIHSDSSTSGWGGLDIDTGKLIQEFWREESSLHINIKELRAAMASVQALAKEGEQVNLSVDNTVSYFYLKKGGGKLQHFNSLLRPFLRWCNQRGISLNLNLVRSEDMLADGISRWTADPGDYRLDRKIFTKILDIFQPILTPKVDMFASPGNHQLELFVARWPHHQAVGCNALEVDLTAEVYRSCWANPPWSIIGDWLYRLRLNPQVTCLMAVPYWVGTTWWPLLVRMHVRQTPVVLVQPREGLFTSCLGLRMPPTRWPLLCLLLSGKNYREGKFLLKISHHI